MEQIQVLTFVTEKGNNTILHRLQLLSVLASRLSTSRVGETDITEPTLKVLAYLPPLPGVSYLNDLQDKLKDLVFHLHLKNERTSKTASLDLSEAKEDFFPPDMSENFSKLFRLQVLLKKEHRSCVELFESYALELYRKRNSDHYTTVKQIIESKRSSLINREEILRNQLENLSIQFAILVERHITKAVRALRYSLKRLVNASEAPSDILDSLQVIRPDKVSHQIYLAASNTYKYPKRPQKLIYCPDCKGAVPAASNGECERAGFSVPDVIYSNVNTSAHNFGYPQPMFTHPGNGQFVHRRCSMEREIDGFRCRSCWVKSKVYVVPECVGDAGETQYARALRSYRPMSGRSLRLHKGDKLKTKLESSDGEWRYGFKKSACGLRKTWGFFQTAVITE